MPDEKWRGVIQPQHTIIEKRVRGKNQSYARWRSQHAASTLEQYCVEALMRFGPQPVMTVAYRGSWRDPRLLREQKAIRAWRQNFRDWCRNTEIANSVVQAAQFRKWFESWYSWHTRENRDGN